MRARYSNQELEGKVYKFDRLVKMGLSEKVTRTVCNQYKISFLFRL